MAWNNLKTGINTIVKSNNNQEITGENLQGVLNTMVNSLGANATFAGVATPDTSPGTPDGPVFYIAGQQGIYTNFGLLQIELKLCELGIFTFNDNAWVFNKVELRNISQEESVKIIESILGISSDIISLAVGSSGYYIKYDGTTIALADSYISAPFYVEAGKTISFTGRASINVAMISRTDASGSTYTPLVVGTGTGNEIPMQTATYKVVDSGYFVVSWYKEKENCKINLSQEIDGLKFSDLQQGEFIDIINTVLEISLNAINLTIARNNYYVKYDGTIVALANSYISTPFYVEAGKTISFTGRASVNIAMISKTDASGSTYNPLVVGVGPGYQIPMQTAVYAVVESGYYAVSWYKEKEDCRINSSNIVDAIKKPKIFKTLLDETIGNSLSEIFIFNSCLYEKTSRLYVLSHLSCLYVLGAQKDNTVTWWAKTKVLDNSLNGRALEIRATNEGGNYPNEVESGNLVGYAIIENIDLFISIEVSQLRNELNLSTISNIYVHPQISSRINKEAQFETQAVNILKKELGVDLKHVDISIGNSDYYVKYDGTVVALADSYISAPFYVEAGKTISFTGRASINLAIISKTDASGSTYVPKVIGTGPGYQIPMQTATYEVVESGYYAVTWYKEKEDCRIENNKAKYAQKFNLLSAYNNITYCGDSLTWSQVTLNSQNSYRQAKKTFPEIISGICNNTETILAFPGASAKTWWERFSSQIETKTNNLFIVYLGTNVGLTNTVETDCSGDDISQYANTQTGYYGRLLRTIQILGDKAILVKINSVSYADTTNLAIESLGIRFNFPVVENSRIEQIIYRYYPSGAGYDNIHLNDLGYTYFANRLIKNISEMPDDMIKRLVIQ